MNDEKEKYQESNAEDFSDKEKLKQKYHLTDTIRIKRREGAAGQ